MVLDALRFDECIRGADLIITGEGKLDKQTCMGKDPMRSIAGRHETGYPGYRNGWFRRGGRGA